MSVVMKYPSYNDPVECAYKVCEWHAANKGDPLTHIEVMVTYVPMGEPEARTKCLGLLKAMTSEGGEFHHLMLEKKFAISHRPTAEKLGMPYRRPRGLEVVNKMLLADRQRAVLADYKHMSDALKGKMTGAYDLVEKFTGRHFGIGRSYEVMEQLKELGATVDSDGRVAAEIIRLKDETIAFLQAAVLALAGGRTVMPQGIGE